MPSRRISKLMYTLGMLLMFPAVTFALQTPPHANGSETGAPSPSAAAPAASQTAPAAAPQPTTDNPRIIASRASGPSIALATGFVNQRVTIGDERYKYVVYVPADYDPNRQWPMILFLHGAGERGDDGLIQTEVGIGRAIRRNPARVPAIVIFPQCRAKTFWWTPEMSQMVVAQLNATGATYNIDPQRVYLTGLSMGGGGCWHFAAGVRNAFAAVVPICAVSDERMGFEESLAPQLTDYPIWAFHGDADKVVPVDESRKMVREINAAGGNARITEFPGVGHDSWDRAYDRSDLWEWLFAQKRESRAPATSPADANAETTQPGGASTRPPPAPAPSPAPSPTSASPSN